MKIALAQINNVVGDIAGNTNIIFSNIDKAKQAGADLVIFPELSVLGTVAHDLLLKEDAIDQCQQAVNKIASKCDGIAALVGYPRYGDDQSELYNAAALCAGGQVKATIDKSVLSDTSIINERAYFKPGKTENTIPFKGYQLHVVIGESLFTASGDISFSDSAQAGQSVLINMAASPFTRGKHPRRLTSLSAVAEKNRAPLVFCNQVGGNDHIIFDGNSCAFSSDGKLLVQAEDFAQDLVVWDIQNASTSAPAQTPKQGMEAVYHALTTAVRDYVQKSGFPGAIVGLSGGIDSSVVAAVAVGALGAAKVMGIAMPSRYSSKGSVADAKSIAANLSIAFNQVPIAGPHDAFENLLTPYFEGRAVNATEENIQARIRGMILMAFSNKFGKLVLATGNKSESAVGYCTLYGDTVGALEVISDLYKTQVYQLARWINDDPDSPLLRQFGKPVIPQNTLDKAPSAELRDGQRDQDSLPQYEILDEIILRFVEKNQSIKKIAQETGFDEKLINETASLIYRSEYKRQQLAPGLRLTHSAFGSDLSMPICQRYRSTAGIKK